MARSARWLWLLLPAAIGGILLLRRPEPPPDPPRPAQAPQQASSVPVAPPVGTASARPPEDPLIRKWQRAILQHDRSGVEQSSAVFLSQEEEYRPRLLTLVGTDPDPRIRAFTVTLLSRFRTPPPEEFFVRALGDAGEPPRDAAIAALGKLGTPACLEALDRAAAADPSERLRGAAAESARRIRAK